MPGPYAQRTPTAAIPLAATYLNRLSDLLFILARAANPAGDVLWVPGGERGEVADHSGAADQRATGE